MTDIAKLDVLIVYNHKVLESPRGIFGSNTPFPSSQDSLNLAYSYFLESCKKQGLSAGLASSSAITGPGTCKSYWTYSGGTWFHNLQAVKSKLIFDKFSPKTPENVALRHLLFSHSNIASYNSYSLFRLFFDKYKTYQALAGDSIPTVRVRQKTLRGIKLACKKLQGLCNDHKNFQDFGQEIILKDRYGAGGRQIYKFAGDDYQKILDVLLLHPEMSFIIQPLLNFDRGFTYNNVALSTDIRFIFLDGKVVSSYLRIAESGDFRCNQHQGGSLIYLDKSDLPRSVLKKATEIARYLNKKSSLFTLDFLIANSGNPYLLEGNTGPGLDWDPNDKRDQAESKKLITLVVKQIALRVKNPKLPRPGSSFHSSKTPFLPRASKTPYPVQAPL